jgi:hypothetical protein
LDCAELSRACIASTSIWIGPSESQGIPPVNSLRVPEISCSPTRATGAPWLLAPVLAKFSRRKWPCQPHCGAGCPCPLALTASARAVHAQLGVPVAWLQLAACEQRNPTF